MVYPWQSWDSDPSFWMEDLATSSVSYCHGELGPSLGPTGNLVMQDPNNELLVSLEVRGSAYPSVGKTLRLLYLVPHGEWRGWDVFFPLPFPEAEERDCCLPSGTLPSLPFNQHISATAHFLKAPAVSSIRKSASSFRNTRTDIHSSLPLQGHFALVVRFCFLSKLFPRESSA